MKKYCSYECALRHIWIPTKDEVEWNHPPREDFFSNAAYTVLHWTVKPLYRIKAEAYIHFFSVRSIRRRERISELRWQKKREKLKNGRREAESRWNWILVSGLVLYWVERLTHIKIYRRPHRHKHTPKHARTWMCSCGQLNQSYFNSLDIVSFRTSHATTLTKMCLCVFWILVHVLVCVHVHTWVHTCNVFLHVFKYG